jgi:hypothetical protein
VIGLWGAGASRRIGWRLRQHGCVPAAGTESFLISKANHLLPGEEEQARSQGAQLVGVTSPR